MVELGLKLTLAYLIGSVIGSLVVGYFRGGVDIRTVGSGNAGGTNALRTQGKAFAFWVMVIDIGKGILAAAVIDGCFVASHRRVWRGLRAGCGYSAGGAVSYRC